jgi:hypothetical protein
MQRQANNPPKTIDDYIEQLPDKVQRTLKVWAVLSESERKQLFEALRQFEKLDEVSLRQMPDIVTNMPNGPYKDRCAWCGRG